MTQKLIKLVVIILGALIIIAFIAIIYGIYLKMGNNNSYIKESISLGLKNNEEILDIIVLDKKNILITVDGDEKKAIIYDINKNKVIRKILK